MPLTAAEKAAIKAIWAKAASREAELGAEVLGRLFKAYPQTKTYFIHYDLREGSKDMLNQGAKVMKAIGSAAHHMDDLDHAVSSFSELHAHKLMAEPGNFKLLSRSMEETMASHFPKEFSSTTKAAWDKFLAAVSSALVSKY